MVKINKIYTRTGDQGETGLVGGKRIRKDSLRVSAYGDVDELNAVVGGARTLAETALVKTEKFSDIAQHLAVIQNELFDLGAELASPAGAGSNATTLLQPTQVQQLETWIDTFVGALPELRSFVLPGGTELNSWLHLARTVCRRAERSVLALHREEPARAVPITYLNRLSDYLFAASRAALSQAGKGEYLWSPGKTRENERP